MRDYICENCQTNEHITYLRFGNKLITWCDSCKSGENLCIKNKESEEVEA